MRCSKSSVIDDPSATSIVSAKPPPSLLMKNNLKLCSFVFWELGRNREESGTSRRPCARAVHDVKFVSRDGVDCVAPRALKFALRIRNVVQIEDGAATRAIDDECRVRASLRVLRHQAEAKAL